MSVRRFLILFLILTLALFGLNACTRERTPWPETYPFEASPFEASPGETLPRFTPHVTSPPPDVTPTPIRPGIKAPEPTLAPVQPSPVPTLAQASAIYTVQPGDTLYDIARAHNAPLQKLAEINHITDPTTIMVGQQLLIP